MEGETNIIDCIPREEDKSRRSEFDEQRITRTEEEKKEMTGTQENQEKKDRRKRSKNNLTEKSR